jgi:GTP-binding protein EngB required for normal cell division
MYYYFMDLPIDNLNVCLVGCVSSGKSTILNTMFCEDLAQTKIKRTTMTPCIFIETEENSTSFDNINKKIAETNNKLIKQSESSSKPPKESDYDPLLFSVDKINIDCCSKSKLLTIFDIPGLNDARTKNFYYNYLRKTFSIFNIVIFIVDINSGINTSDEVDILNFISEQTAIHKINKKIHTLVVVNKADDMQEVRGDELEIIGELKEMFDQVDQTVREQYKQNNIEGQLIDIIPICALDAYLYRMIQTKGSDFKLKPEVVLKIGINEQGKKFSKLPVEQQNSEVKKIISDEEFINDMIKLSGYSKFVSKLNNFLTDETSSKLVIDNLMQRYNKLTPLDNIIINNHDLIEHIYYYDDLLTKIKPNDESLYKQKVNELISEINTGIKYKIKQLTDINEILTYYDEIKETLNQTFLKFYYDKPEYPEYVKSYVINLIQKNFQNKNHIFDITTQLSKLIDIKCSYESISQCIKTVIDNVYGLETISFYDYNPDILIKFLNKLKQLELAYFLPFIRFLILNLHKGEIDTQRYFLYKSYNELYISTFLGYTQNSISDYVYGLNKDIEYNDPKYLKYKLDIYYLIHNSKNK